MRSIDSFFDSLQRFLDDDKFCIYSVTYIDFVSNELIFDVKTESKSFYFKFLLLFNQDISFNDWNYTFEDCHFKLNLYVQLTDDDGVDYD